MKQKYLLPVLLVALLILPAGLLSAGGLAQNAGSQSRAPLGTAFTYQGLLTGEGDPVEGPCDFQFGLWDDPVTGTLVAGPLQQTAVPLAAGQPDAGDLLAGRYRLAGGFWADAHTTCEDVVGADLAFAPPQPRAHEPVRFTGTVQAGTGPLTYTWAFDDGGTAQGWEMDHAFASIGDHVVTLTVANPCSEDIAVTTVHVADWRLFLPLVVHQDDAFEPDNTWEQASRLVPGVDQLHDVDPVVDQDWVKFAAAYGNTYEILVLNTGPSLDSFLELFGRDGVTPIDTNDDCADPQYASCITFTPAVGGDGDYYVRVSDYEWHGGPVDYAYTIRLR